MANFPHRPLAVDLFAGAGGFSLGIEQAGFDVALAVEQDPIHGAVYAFNSPQTKVLCTDITTLSGQEIQKALREWATERGQNQDCREVSSKVSTIDLVIDLVIGGPPCQGFSLIGKRQVDDVRNNLVFEFCRLVKELQPRYFVMENVPGLAQNKYQHLFEQLISDFKAAGYTITEPVQVLNAADFGVPQKRRRLFLLGSRLGEAPVAYPSSELGSHQWVTVKDAIADLPNLDDFPELMKSDCVELTPEQLDLLQALAMPYVEKLRDLITDRGNFAYPRQWNPQLLTSSLQTQHTEASIERFRNTPMGEVETTSRLRRLHWDQPCHTLRAGTGYKNGRYTSPRPIHPDYPRVISVREAARLHSFPDWFRFHHTKWHGFRQVGNAVPPRLGRVLGKQIMTALAQEPSVPTTTIKLSDTKLLRFKQFQASKYWTILVFIPFLICCFPSPVVLFS
ncbi:MAG: DNA cytosine methyltransferase [Moorea sp. SIO3G5]|nr:DNA cytosine methyltransferase [Moorena sp. SIO3G5]